MQIRVEHDLRDVRADLESVRLGLGREVTLALIEAGEPLLTLTRAETPLGPGPELDGHGDDLLEHIRDSLKIESRGRVLKIVSRHPGAGVLNFGGTIHPHGAPIEFPARLMAQRAAEQELPTLEQALSRRIDALLAHNHLA
jgi:hypothetical protein